MSSQPTITDHTPGSNIVSLENLNDVNQKYLLKEPKKGKLHKGPNWTAFKRENLGSIPRSVEKIIIEDKNHTTKLGFTVQTERFTDKDIGIRHGLPGPGTYNISKDFDYTTTSSSFYSSKGYGNGFISGTDRFDDQKLYCEKYRPGPGQYKTDKVCSLEKAVSSTLLGKSLYSTKEVKSLKVKEEHPGPGTYNPIVDTFNINKDGPEYAFKSTLNRFKNYQKTILPGPGDYFKNKPPGKMTHTQDTQDNKGKTMSYFFKSPTPQKENLLEKFEIKTNQEKDDITFKLVQNSKIGSIILGQAHIGEDNLAQVLNLEDASAKNPFILTKKDLFKLRNRTFCPSRSNKRNLSASGNQIQLIKQATENDPGYKNLKNTQIEFEDSKAMQYVHQLLGKDKKEDLFVLSSPRWKESQLDFKVPGPAYYNPRLPQSKLSFNRNEKIFLFSPGASNPNMDENGYNI